MPGALGFRVRARCYRVVLTGVWLGLSGQPSGRTMCSRPRPFTVWLVHSLSAQVLCDFAVQPHLLSYFLGPGLWGVIPQSRRAGVALARPQSRHSHDETVRPAATRRMTAPIENMALPTRSIVPPAPITGFSGKECQA